MWHETHKLNMSVFGMIFQRFFPTFGVINPGRQKSYEVGPNGTGTEIAEDIRMRFWRLKVFPYLPFPLQLLREEHR